MFLIKAGKKYIKSSEELVSMLLGLAIMVVVVVLIFNFVQRKKGTVEIPGTNDVVLSENAIKEKQDKENSYTVQKGDNLWKIAVKRYNDGYAWTKIAKENNLKNPGMLYTGQELKMPVIEQKTETKISTNTNTSVNTIDQGADYKVARGDSLWKIAVKAYGDGYKWTTIYQENKAIIPHANGLEIGMTIKIPKI